MDGVDFNFEARIITRMEKLIPKHGGYRSLKSFQLARLVYDLTLRFCDKFIRKYSRTHDQMVQAARSGVQNIAEGSQASGTSKKTEIKLTNVARASLEELLLDYEDFLRQNRLTLWKDFDPRRAELVNQRFFNADKVARWVHNVHLRDKEPIPQIAANALLILVSIACNLLNRQLTTLADDFTNNGGITERLYRVRSQARQRN